MGTKEKIYWTTKQGEKIDIDKMSITHLRNVLKMILRENISTNCVRNIDDAYDEEILDEIKASFGDHEFWK